MKRKLAIVLSLALAISALAGCGSKEAPAADTPAAEAPEAEAQAPAPAEDGAAAGGKVLKVGVSWAHYNDALFYAWGEGMEQVLKDNCKDHGYDSVEWISLVAEDLLW